MGRTVRKVRGDVDDERGSVSIYFIAATAGLVLLTALLVDFARVAAFRKQAELAAKSGVRSVLSSFDPVLYSRYGLFVRGGDPADALFADTLAGNAQSGEGGAFPYLDTRWESSGVTESRPIAGHDVFRRQVLEEMKYKAPIDLTLELADRLRGLTGMIEETRKTVDLLERMQEAYDRREAALDEALAKQRALGNRVQASLSPAIPYPSVPIAPGAATGNVANIADAANQYDDYVAKRTEDEARREALRAQEEERRRQEEENRKQREEAAKAGGGGKPIDLTDVKTPVLPSLPLPQYEAIVAGYETGVSRLAADLNAAARTAGDRAEALYADARDAWAKAYSANEEMSRIAAEGAEIVGAQPGPAVTPDSDSPAEQAQAMAELRRKAKELVLEPAFFSDYEAEISRQREAGRAVVGQAAAFASSASSLPASSGRGSGIRGDAESLQRAFADFARAYGSSGEVLAARESSFRAYRSQDEERKREEEKAKSEWSGASRLLGLLTGKGGTPEEREAFEKLNELRKRNLEWNKAEDEAAAEVAERSDDPDKGRDEALSGTGDLLNIVEDSLLGVRDRLYYSEYAISRMTRYEPVNVKAMFEGREAPLPAEAQQTEYILYGFANPSGNIAAAYGEIFAFRLAVRTMEGFVECSKLGHPLLVLVAALVYGIRNAVLDLHSLVDKGTIQLSKYAKVQMTYTDYLRLFLLLHGGSDNQTARMIAIIEYETGVSFQEAYTYASGEATASVKLWFFPGLTRLLGRNGSLGGSVRGDRYEATYRADMAYQ